MDDFLFRALLAGAGVALIAGPLGCFIVWRRMAYFGDTMAHSALLGVALSVLFDVNITLGVFVVATFGALALIMMQRRAPLSSDALLGILSHSMLALGIVIVAMMTWLRIDPHGIPVWGYSCCIVDRYRCRVCGRCINPGLVNLHMATTFSWNGELGISRGLKAYTPSARVLSLCY